MPTFFLNDRDHRRVRLGGGDVRIGCVGRPRPGFLGKIWRIQIVLVGVLTLVEVGLLVDVAGLVRRSRTNGIPDRPIRSYVNGLRIVGPGRVSGTLLDVSGRTVGPSDLGAAAYRCFEFIGSAEASLD